MTSGTARARDRQIICERSSISRAGSIAGRGKTETAWRSSSWSTVAPIIKARGIRRGPIVSYGLLLHYLAADLTSLILAGVHVDIRLAGLVGLGQRIDGDGRGRPGCGRGRGV